MSTQTYPTARFVRIARVTRGTSRRQLLLAWLRRGQLGSGYSRDWPSTADARAI